MGELCVSIQQGKLSRWQQAFPDGVIIDAVSPLVDGGDGYCTIWLHDDGLSHHQVNQCLEQLRQMNSAYRPIVISCVPDSAKAMLFFQHGAMGYCHAMATPKMLQQVALVVRNGGLWLGPDLMNRFSGSIGQRETSPVSSALEKLSVREKQVAELVATGSSNKEVANTLAITERTVKAHMSSILEKLSIRDRLQLALLITPQKN